MYEVKISDHRKGKEDLHETKQTVTTELEPIIKGKGQEGLSTPCPSNNTWLPTQGKGKKQENDWLCLPLALVQIEHHISANINPLQSEQEFLKVFIFFFY